MKKPGAERVQPTANSPQIGNPGFSETKISIGIFERHREPAVAYNARVLLKAGYLKNVRPATEPDFEN